MADRFAVPCLSADRAVRGGWKGMPKRIHGRKWGVRVVFSGIRDSGVGGLGKMLWALATSRALRLRSG